MIDIFCLKNLNDIPPELRHQLVVERVLEAEKRLHDAITLRKQGFTYKDIGLKIGVTKQAVHKLLKRNSLNPSQTGD